MTIPSSRSSWPRRLRVSFWRPIALSTCSSVTSPISLRMSPRRSLLVRWLRTMFSSTSSVVTPRSPRLGSRVCAGVDQQIVDHVGRRRPVGLRPARLPAGSMMGSSSSPPRPVRWSGVVCSVVLSSLDRIPHHFQRRRQTRPETERLGRLTQQHRHAVDDGRSASLRRHEEVGRRGSVYRIEYDLPRRYVIGQHGGDFTLSRHAQRGRVDDDALAADEPPRQLGATAATSTTRPGRPP